MPYDYDAIVVGSGAGGATFAYRCARAGKSVLLLERGGPLQQPAAHDEQAMLIDRVPYDDRAVEVNGRARRLYMGGVLGGGTSLYGAALLRPSTDDFHPGRHYGRRVPRAIWDWPIRYDELASSYTAAEQLYGVAGSTADDLAPLHKPAAGYPMQPLPVHPANHRLVTANRAAGLRPFRLPLAIDPARCLRCGPCAGYLCPTGARRSSAHLLQHAVDAGLPLHVRTEVEVERLLLDGPARGICLHDRRTGQRSMHTARRYVLAAGAIGSPLVLLRSGAMHPLIGRHYMMHLSPVVVGIWPRARGADASFVKQIGFADFYYGTAGYAHKLGIVQSLPVPGPLLLRKMAPLVPRPLLSFMRRRMLPLAGIVEDLPDPANRVDWGPNGQPSIRHRFGQYDIERGRRLSGLMAGVLRRAGSRLCLAQQMASEEHVAHQCGTLRFGTDPANAVLDRDCRVFAHPNVFVVDGSFMPTSLGVGPALTIIANAVRVAGVVIREL
jgi:choline dehydrogenase-like flavoprotein